MNAVTLLKQMPSTKISKTTSYSVLCFLRTHERAQTVPWCAMVAQEHVRGNPKTVMLESCQKRSLMDCI